jgi:hypothetical protein
LNAADLAREGREARKLFEDAIRYHDDVVEKAADLERQYRKLRAVKFVQAPQGSVEWKKTWVDAETADLRYQRDIAAGQVKSALELVRQRRQETSLLQSEAASHREEARFALTGPEAA